MRAMILAAGRGKRMRPLTDTCPKPLLEVAGKPLIVHTLERLARAGYREAVINLAHLGERIRERLGHEQAGLRLMYSLETPNALETAGGIRQALPLLGDAPFLVINGDVWCDHPLTPPAIATGVLAHVVLVDNPPHHPRGDFELQGGHVHAAQEHPLTFSGIGWYRPDLFRALEPGSRPLGPILRTAMAAGQVTGEHHTGDWRDIGTPERLAALDAELRTRETPS